MREQIHANKRRVTGIANKEGFSTIPLGDILSHNYIKLLAAETRASFRSLAHLCELDVQNGGTYVISSYSPLHRPKAPELVMKSDRTIAIDVWIQTNGSMGNRFILADHGSYEFVQFVKIENISQPKWWDIEDDVVVGDSPFYVGEEVELAA